MRFAGTILETYPNGVTLAVEVRVEAPDGDAARPVADAAMAALEARRLWQGVTRRVVPVALVDEASGEVQVIRVTRPERPRPFVLDVADDDGMRRDSRE